MNRFTDKAPLTSKPRRTGDGYLVAQARCVRTGVQQYLASEVGLVGDGVVNVYRDEAEVFAAASLQSFSHAPITLDHPAEAVSADNWADLSVGEVSTAAARDGDWVSLPLILKDTAAIAALDNGTRELSAGYTCDLDMTAGVTADGVPYQARQTNIRINHLALVDRARAGHEARIEDGAAPWGVVPVTTVLKEDSMPEQAKTRTIIVDGLSVDTTDAGAQAIDKLQRQLADAATAAAAATEAHQAALATRDADVAKAQAERDAAAAKVLTDAQLDERVAQRADLISKAKAIFDADYSGKSDAEVRKAAVLGATKDAALGDKPDAYLEARFDILAQDADVDPVTRELHKPAPHGGRATADAAYSDMLARQSGAWAGKKETA